jgi:hypothetical protein
MKTSCVIKLLLSAALFVVVTGAAQNERKTPSQDAVEKHPLVQKVKEFRATRKRDPKATQAFLSDDPRVWYEKKEGAGQPWHLDSDPWAHWDKFFKSQSTDKDWQVEDRAVSVAVVEINDFYRLIDRAPSPVRLTWFFNDAGKISGFLVQSMSKGQSDRLGEFSQWARQHHPTELDYLMPQGRIKPEGDRAERWKALLIKWRAAAGLLPVR